MHKLNFGSGHELKDGWYNVDTQDFGQPYVGSSELFTDNYFDVIVAHCSLQMVEYHLIISVLKDLHRVLKPNGVLRISLPDIVKGFGYYIKGDISFFPNGEDDLDIRFSSWLTWYSSSKTLLTRPALILKLKEAGFSQCALTQYKQSILSTNEITELDTRNHECYFIESLK